MNHFDEMTCLLYLEGQLERPRALQLSAHTEQCVECRALLRALESESRLLTRALVEEDEAAPARLLQPQLRGHTPWAWIVSMGLAAAGVYTLWTGMVDPWLQQLNQAGFGGTSLLTLLFFRGTYSLSEGWQTMANILQIISICAVGILAFGLLRRSRRRRTMLAIVMMGAVAAALTLPHSARAADVRPHSENFTLPAGETVKNDLIVRSRTVRIDGNVEGDLIAFCQTLTVNGRVNGDIIGFAQIVRINGATGGSVRVFSRDLEIGGAVTRNVTAFGARVELDPKAEIGGGMMFFGGEATLDGRIHRDFMTYSGRTALNGHVGGDLWAKSGQLSVGPTTEIDGKAVYTGEKQPDVSPQAKLAHPIEVHIEAHRPSYMTSRFYISWALRWAVAFVYGMLLAVLMPGFFADAVRSSRNYGLSFGVGALTCVGGCVLAVIAVVLLAVGLAGGVIALLIFGPALYATQVVVGVRLGEQWLGPSRNTGETVARLALGLLVIRALWIIPIFGWVVWLAVILWGLGALVVTLYRGARPPAMPSAQPAA